MPSNHPAKGCVFLILNVKDSESFAPPRLLFQGTFLLTELQFWNQLVTKRLRKCWWGGGSSGPRGGGGLQHPSSASPLGTKTLRCYCEPLWNSVGLRIPGIYQIPCVCGQVYIGQKGCTIIEQLGEHQRYIRFDKGRNRAWQIVVLRMAMFLCSARLLC